MLRSPVTTPRAANLIGLPGAMQPLPLRLIELRQAAQSRWGAGRPALRALLWAQT